MVKYTQLKNMHYEIPKAIKIVVYIYIYRWYVAFALIHLHIEKFTFIIRSLSYALSHRQNETDLAVEIFEREKNKFAKTNDVDEKPLANGQIQVSKSKKNEKQTNKKKNLICTKHNENK